jgi:hypothetical protein
MQADLARTYGVSQATISRLQAIGLSPAPRGMSLFEGSSGTSPRRAGEGLARRLSSSTATGPSRISAQCAPVREATDALADREGRGNEASTRAG